jgi:hypothetical protein
MKNITINGDVVTVDGAEYKKVDKTPEPAPEWQPRVGELCAFSDFDKTDHWTIDYLIRCESGYFISKNGGQWYFCRPLQNPNIMQMIPWSGGVCPVAPTKAVLIKRANGSFNLEMAGYFIWHHPDREDPGRNIIAYTVLS